MLVDMDRGPTPSQHDLGLLISLGTYLDISSHLISSVSSSSQSQSQSMPPALHPRRTAPYRTAPRRICTAWLMQNVTLIRSSRLRSQPTVRHQRSRAAGAGHGVFMAGRSMTSSSRR